MQYELDLYLKLLLGHVIRIPGESLSLYSFAPVTVVIEKRRCLRGASLGTLWHLFTVDVFDKAIAPADGSSQSGFLTFFSSLSIENKPLDRAKAIFFPGRNLQTKKRVFLFSTALFSSLPSLTRLPFPHFHSTLFSAGQIIM